MAIEVRMPKLTDTMEEGIIVRWLKQVGESVNAGEILAEVETDKADMELEAVADGVVREITVGEGGSAPVGATIAILSAPGEAVVAQPVDRDRAPTAPRVTQTGDGASGTATVSPQVSPAAPRPATPLARRVARQANVELHEVAGSGPHGRITKRDVGAARQPTAAIAKPPAPTPGVGRVELTKMRQTIARRMAEAIRDIPHFYVTSEIDMGEAMRLRASLDETGMLSASVTVTHLLLKAVALALQRHPRVNAAWADGAVVFNEAVNIGIATAVDDGLLVPVLKGCERLSLAEVAAAARGLHEKAKGGRFASDEMLGGTFTVSNMGMLDIEEFTAIINPPQAAILSVGAIKPRPVVRGGAIAVGQTMRVTLGCDHRVLNGVEGARFLEELKRMLENPVVLVMA